jgi:sugar diacid utilization regulator
MKAVVYVEGKTDRIALEALAARLGRDLAAEDVAIVVTGGAQNIRNVVAPQAAKQVGLCDRNEERWFRRVLEEVYVCDADLEHELIRALTPAGVERVFAEHADLESFRKFQRQPAQVGRPHVAQLHRFMCSSRKTLYPARLVAALDLARVPPPLGAVLAAAQG